MNRRSALLSLLLAPFAARAQGEFSLTPPEELNIVFHPVVKRIGFIHGNRKLTFTIEEVLDILEGKPKAA